MNNLLGERFSSTRYICIVHRGEDVFVSSVNCQEAPAIAEAVLDGPYQFRPISSCVLVKMRLTEHADVSIEDSRLVSGAYIDEMIEAITADEEHQ